MCNEDTALTSRTAWRLYKRVVYEVDVRNYIHLVTMLPKTADTALLTKDGTSKSRALF